MLLGSKVKFFLEHHGVKGQKWGVRKSRNGSGDDRDVVLRKGSEIHNVSKDRPRKLTDHLYTSHTPKDNAYYRGAYASQLKMFLGADKVFDNAFEVTKQIKAPGKSKRVTAFKDLYNKDPNTMSKALANTKVTTSLGLSLAKKMGLKVESRYTKKYSDLGKKELSSDRIQRLMSQTLTVNKSVRDQYFNSLIKKGYNATVDDNDKSMGADAPLIVFKGKDNLRKKRSVEITDSEMKVAMAEFDRLAKEG